MPEPTAVEVIPKAIVKEGLAATPPGIAKEMAQKISDELNKGAWRDGLKAAERKIDQGKADIKIDQIGSTYNAASGAKERTTGSGSESRRHTKAKEAVRDVKVFLEKGLDSCPQKAALINSALERFKLRPLIATELAALPGDAERKAFVERILRDPRTTANTQELLDGRLNGGFDDATILAAIDAVAEKEIDKTNAQAEYDDVNSRVKTVDTQLRAFARPRTGTPGTKAGDIDTLRAALPTVQAEIPLKKANVRAAQARVETLTEEFRASQVRGWTGRPTADIFTELGTTRTEFTTAQTELSDREGQVQKLTDLEAEEARLKEDKATLSADLRQKKTTLDKATLELGKRNRDLQAARALRTTQENDFVAGLENILLDAGEATLDDDITKATSRFETDLEKLKNEATNAKDKTFYEALQKIWLGAERTRKIGLPGRRRTEKYRPIDKVKVYEHFSILMENGDEAMFKRVLAQTTNPDTGTYYIATEIDELIKDTEFTNRMKPEAVKQLLGRKFLAGGITQEDIHVISTSQWGQGMIEKAIQSNNEFRTAVSAVMGADALNRHGFVERFGQVAKEHPWWIALIAGIPFAIAAAKGMSVTSEAINNQTP